jgi:hypothetical protein
MARYFYAWIPAVALAAVTLFIVPFLGLIAAPVFAAGALAALAALVWKIVAALGAFARFLLGFRPGDIRVPRARTTGLTVQAQTAPALQHHRS